MSTTKDYGGMVDANADGGAALQIVRIIDNVSYELDEQALAKILLDEEVSNRKIMVVALSGIVNAGKSFLANVFLKYLKNLGKPNWMDDPSEPMVGFEWSAKTNTDGIMIWSKPFFIPMPSGEKVGILVVDTQGIYRIRTSVQEWGAIFALSSLISSIQIYSLETHIGTDTLQCLECFGKYGEKFSPLYKDKPFQTLYLLSRDWPDPKYYPFGLDGGNEYLKTVMKTKGCRAEVKMIKNINQCFETINCFLMPSPGSYVYKSIFKGDLSDPLLRPEFKEHLKGLTEHLFDPKNLVVKEVAGKQITGRYLFQFFKDNIRRLQTGNLPILSSIRIVDNHAVDAVDSAKKIYKKEMNKVFDKIGLSRGTMKDNHERSLNLAMQRFSEEMNGEVSSTQWEKLSDEFKQMYAEYMKNYEAKLCIASSEVVVPKIDGTLTSAMCILYFIAFFLVAIILSLALSKALDHFVSFAMPLVVITFLSLVSWCYCGRTCSRWLQKIFRGLYRFLTGLNILLLP